MFFKTTSELKDYIEELYAKVKPLATKKGIYGDLKVYFSEGTPQNMEGAYCYSDKRGYHYCYTERGEITFDNTTQNLFEISYWVIEPEISTMATDYARKNRVKKQDSRRIYFREMIELLNCIGENYRKYAEIKIDEILKIAPYQDDLY